MRKVIIIACAGCALLVLLITVIGSEREDDRTMLYAHREASEGIIRKIWNVAESDLVARQQDGVVRLLHDVKPKSVVPLLKDSHVGGWVGQFGDGWLLKFDTNWRVVEIAGFTPAATDAVTRRFVSITIDLKQNQVVRYKNTVPVTEYGRVGLNR
jgi:hypothetical protein